MTMWTMTETGRGETGRRERGRDARSDERDTPMTTMYHYVRFLDGRMGKQQRLICMLMVIGCEYWRFAECCPYLMATDGWERERYRRTSEREGQQSFPGSFFLTIDKSSGLFDLFSLIWLIC